ncbi:hypothetical protein BDK51DRAFT_30907 [Blyttiomyces helicus]|uniref:Uncharacterized protein n=1 Tax=Blyttiomyces helicus TaxID=388810 RepID=A0A4P9WEM1_9FUNG|nr:hypothetical protein BDK51DRAFT_30907 [Blyttiomyces helicus]|eukprot:RKO88846.1 hypothetical protein BDK51DRAFT_30907 [Blyttiomyces helicus]
MDLARVPHPDIERHGWWASSAIDAGYLRKSVPLCALCVLAAYCWEGGDYYLDCTTVLPIQELRQMVLPGPERSWQEVGDANAANPGDPQLAAADFLAAVELFWFVFLQDSVVLMDLASASLVIDLQQFPPSNALLFHLAWLLCPPDLDTSCLHIRAIYCLPGSPLHPYAATSIGNYSQPEMNRKVDIMAKVLNQNMRLIANDLAGGFSASVEESSNLGDRFGLVPNMVSGLVEVGMQSQAIQGATTVLRFAADGAVAAAALTASPSCLPAAAVPSGSAPGPSSTPATAPESPTSATQAPALPTGKPEQSPSLPSQAQSAVDGASAPPIHDDKMSKVLSTVCQAWQEYWVAGSIEAEREPKGERHEGTYSCAGSKQFYFPFAVLFLHSSYSAPNANIKRDRGAEFLGEKGGRVGHEACGEFGGCKVGWWDGRHWAGGKRFRGGRQRRGKASKKNSKSGGVGKAKQRGDLRFPGWMHGSHGSDGSEQSGSQAPVPAADTRRAFTGAVTNAKDNPNTEKDLLQVLAVAIKRYFTRIGIIPSSPTIQDAAEDTNRQLPTVCAFATEKEVLDWCERRREADGLGLKDCGDNWWVSLWEMQKEWNPQYNMMTYGACPRNEGEARLRPDFERQGNSGQGRLRRRISIPRQGAHPSSTLPTPTPSPYSDPQMIFAWR